MSAPDILLLCAVSQMYFLTTNEKKLLLENIDTADRLALLSVEDISFIIHRRCRAAGWNGSEIVRQAEKSAGIIRRLGISYVLHENLPELLKEIPDVPFMLFYRGRFDALRAECISVVGTRRLTPDGRAGAYAFGFDAAKAGMTVVSGLAFGADERAHEGAVAAGGCTAAVLPCGADTVIPSAHVSLAVRILECGGCLVSEYAPGIPAEKWRFVQRNRIVAGLSQSVVVIQAPPGSGALLTADFALGYGRDVLFHKAAFCEQAAAVAARERNKLSLRVAHGEKKRYKLENIPEKYISEGAPVIQDFADYKRWLSEIPGSRSGCAGRRSDALQPELF
jgi:DNA processing protein